MKILVYIYLLQLLYSLVLPIIFLDNDLFKSATCTTSYHIIQFMIYHYERSYVHREMFILLMDSRS